MSTSFISQYALIQGSQVHYLDNNQRDKPPLLMLHAITGNAFIFNALVHHGLDRAQRLIIPDLRGRGETAKLTNRVSIADQCQDLAQLLDYLELDKVAVCGHSFGGYLGIYFAAHYPDRVRQLILIDTVAELNPMTPLLIQLSLGRVFMQFPSAQAYRTMVHAMPFMTIHDDLMEPFFKADMSQQPDGGLKPTAHWRDIAGAIADVYTYTGRDWRRMLLNIPAPTLVLTASEPFAFGHKIVEELKVIETLALLSRARHRSVKGNHFTMIFGEGARTIATEIEAFLRSTNHNARENTKPHLANRHSNIVSEEMPVV